MIALQVRLLASMDYIYRGGTKQNIAGRDRSPDGLHHFHARVLRALN